MFTLKSKSIDFIERDGQQKSMKAYLKLKSVYCHTLSLTDNGTSELSICSNEVSLISSSLFFEKDIKGDLIWMMTNICTRFEL